MKLPAESPIPQFSDIVAAQRRIAGVVRKTPIVSHPALDAELGCRVWCKCENLQAVGAFKIRGAANAILKLRERGISADVATHSSGNHGAAVALAARRDGRRAVVVMPRDSVAAKIRNVHRWGGEVRLCAPGQEAREAGLEALVAEGMVPIPPYDHADIVCGQGTSALEFLGQRADLEILMAPVGGGGLMSGCAIAARHLSPEIGLFAAEPAGAADTAERFHGGTPVGGFQPVTIADGLRAAVGELPFRIIREHIDDVLTVSEDAILAGMELAWKHLNMPIEPSSATVFAALLEHPGRFNGARVGVILTGGNVDLDRFPRFAAPGPE